MATFLALAVSVIVRLTALYVGLSRRFAKVEVSTLAILAIFSAFLGFLMPATGFLDVMGAIFRLVLFSVIVMVLTRLPFTDCLSVVLIAVIIENVMVFVLSITPLAFLVAGLPLFTLP
jgi:hypothetical protein